MINCGINGVCELIGENCRWSKAQRVEEPDGLRHYIAVEKRGRNASLVMKLDGQGYLHDIQGGSNHLILAFVFQVTTSSLPSASCNGNSMDLQPPFS